MSESRLPSKVTDATCRMTPAMTGADLPARLLHAPPHTRGNIDAATRPHQGKRRTGEEPQTPSRLQGNCGFSDTSHNVSVTRLRGRGKDRQSMRLSKHSGGAGGRNGAPPLTDSELRHMMLGVSVTRGRSGKLQFQLMDSIRACRIRSLCFSV